MNEIPEEENPPLETTGLLGLFESPVKKEKDSSAGNDTGTPYSLTGSFNPLSPPPTKEITSYDDLDNTTADIDAPAGSVSRMMAMFRVPPPINKDSSSQPTLERPSLERQSTAKRSNRMPLENSENTPLLDSSLPSHSRIPSWKDYFHISATDSTPKTSVTTRKQYLAESAKVAHTRMPSVAMPAISESSQDKQSPSRTTRWGGAIQHISSFLKTSVNEAMKPTTYIGSFMFLLYHVVFCLALGSAITRPNNPTSILGLMTKTSALGILAASIVYWLTLGPEIPALYPTVDLFLAPMLAHLAKIVDQTLAEDGVSGQENDTVFLATFGVLSGIGIAFSGLIIYLATIFKLANLGSFLPFPVICGFFSAVGVLTWTLAVGVDNGGKSVGAIIIERDPHVIIHAIIHHLPSVVVASVMKYLGPKNPFYVILVVFVTIGLFYVVMFVADISLDDAREMGWFWSHDELVYKSNDTPIGFTEWAPPAPFGVLNQLFSGFVHWRAVLQGTSTSAALGFLYLIRCSVHGTALKKNIPNLSRTVRTEDKEIIGSPKISSLARTVPVRSRKFSEAVDIEAVMLNSSSKTQTETEAQEFTVICAKPTNIGLKGILVPYYMSQLLAALVGGFAITPSVAASPTMFMLGAGGVAPQVGSVLLLLIFYTTDFQLVAYIPKPAFSSMLVLAFIDMTYTWFYKSYFKTKDKSEWMVVPAIVICAFAFDLLSAVFLGIAFSTFIFVASFFRSGVVKYVANGVIIHSTIERPFKSSDWLNENGDLIQIVVLQNYLFFGNSSSVYTYICTMFEEKDRNDEECDEGARRPEFLVIDSTLVTGMDTSTVDVFNDIRNLCTSNGCKLLMAGMSPNLRTILALGGFKPETGIRSNRKLRFFTSLDAALGKAEDMLLDSGFDEKEISGADRRERLLSEGLNGFRTALRHIDEEHGDYFSMKLVGLQEYTTPLELNPNDRLYSSEATANLERGLFFIECGIMKLEHNTDATATRGTMRSISFPGSEGYNTGDSLTKIQAKSLLQYASLLNVNKGECGTFRLARIGPGWVAGTVEAVSGMQRKGDTVAVTHCRLHHLPFSKLEEVENTNPSLVLHLYKLLSYLMARRSEATMGQLATLHTIMTSPATVQSLSG